MNAASDVASRIDDCVVLDMTTLSDHLYIELSIQGRCQLVNIGWGKREHS